MVTGGKGAVAAIGNFDGVHRGHRFLLSETAKFARARGAPTGVVVFDPHPRRFFRPADPPFLLTTPEKRDELLRAAGVDVVHSLPFHAELAALSPEAFVRDILKERLRLAGVVTGAEFRFGKARAGDAAALKRICESEGIAAETVSPLMGLQDGAKIGSSAIRAAIAGGDMSGAAEMLGRPWSVGGVVTKGRELGRTIGFPTANIALGEHIEPRRGVYAVRVRVRAADHVGVANFGRRPTIGASTPLLETHLFDFSGDLYGVAIEVFFVEFIRDEQKFEGIDALRAQIAKDCEEAKRRLACYR